MTTNTMTSDQKFWLTAIAIVCATACCLILSVAGYYSYTTKKALEQGYEQQSLPGQVGTYWVKRENAK